MTKRILDKLDKIEVQIDDICGRVLKMEIELSNHFDDIDKRQKKKDRKFYIVIAAMGILFTVVEILQNVRS